MRSHLFHRRFSAVALMLALLFGLTGNLAMTQAQSRRQPPTSDKKKNKRPDPTQPGQEETPTDIVGKPQDAETITVTTNIINIEAVVYHKKSGQAVTALKKENFAIFEDGVQKDITNFSTPESPITVAMVVEYSKLSERYGGGGYEPGRYEVLRPMAMFLSGFIKPPEDYVSLIAFDLRPTPITDFTNDPGRIRQAMNLMLKNFPAFSDTNLYDALQFTLIGGKGDSVVLENSKSRTAEYAGLVDVQGRRRAVLLIASGLDTFSKINYDKARKITQNAGIPIYIIGTLNFFYKKYGDMIGATDDLLGNPGRMSFLQAQQVLKTFAAETGGAYYPITFEGEIPSALQSINAMMRSQYSLAFDPGEQKRDGKKRKIVVKVDIDGDGQYDDKEFVVNHRPFYNAPKDEKK
ncbi:MAG: VWA domain-containing protein [Pyrinomonadaceae bacterium]|nr:VWA domain-containing protein [Pyrinomonadaceae bacterium]